MKKNIKKCSAVFMAAALALSMFSGCSRKKEETVSDVDNRTPVEVQTMSNGSIKKELKYTGKVEPNETVTVTSKLSGLAENVRYDVGDYVNAGDILFSLDKKDIENQIKNLEASLKVSDASVKSAQSGLSQAANSGQLESNRLTLQSAVDNAQTAVESAQKAVENAEIQVENTRVTLEDTEKKYNDTKTLYDNKVVSRSDFESVELAYTQAQNAYEQVQIQLQQAQTTYDQAVSGLEQARQALEIFEEQIKSDNVETAQNSVNTAVASRESVLTQLQIARDSLADTSVKAPISGYISAKNISDTNMVSAQSAPYTIVDVSKVTVDVNVSEKIINIINVDQSVDVVISSSGKDQVAGIIKTISPTADASNTYPVKIEIENPNSNIKAGMYAEIHFIESQAHNTFVVPRNTVLENDKEQYVFVVRDGKVVKTVIETGIDDGENIQIISGVNMGDNVVVSGQDYVVDGEEVRVVNGEEDSETSSQENQAKGE